MKKIKKHVIMAIVILLVAVLAFGYAYLTTTLSINGITDIDRNSWDVYFDNVQVTNGSVSGAQEIEAPTITSDTEVEFHVNLKKPGDFYEFTIEARNDGTIDAMIDTVEKKLNGVVVTTLPAYLNYTVTYEDGLEIEDHHLLAAESLETYRIRVEYRSDINPGDLPNDADSLTLSFGVGYVQSDTSASPARTYIYSTTYELFTIGSAPPVGVTYYDNYQDAIDNFERDFFMRHTLSNGIITATYGGFVLDDNVYYVRCGGGTINPGTGFSNNDSIYYESNKAIIQEAFGESACHEVVSQYDEAYKEYVCTRSTQSFYLRVVVDKEGEIWLDGGSYLCIFNPIQNTSSCGTD